MSKFRPFLRFAPHTSMDPEAADPFGLYLNRISALHEYDRDPFGSYLNRISALHEYEPDSFGSYLNRKSALHEYELRAVQLQQSRLSISLLLLYLMAFLGKIHHSKYFLLLQ